MQRKIEELIKLHVYPICEYPSGIPDAEELPLVTFGAADIAANEIAKLFERKVIWEGEATLQHWTSNGVQLTAIATEIGGGNLLGEIGSDYQRVRVIVEEIDESRT